MLRLSTELELDPSVAVAVVLTESAGAGFGTDGRLIIRFEAHMFYQYWGEEHPEIFDKYFRFDESQRWREHQWRPDPQQEWHAYHGNQGTEWQAFELARRLDETAALQATSMGAPQLMGFQYAVAGYPSVQAMFESFQESEEQQLIGLFRSFEGAGSWTLSNVRIFLLSPKRIMGQIRLSYTLVF